MTDQAKFEKPHERENRTLHRVRRGITADTSVCPRVHTSMGIRLSRGCGAFHSADQTVLCEKFDEGRGRKRKWRRRVQFSYRLFFITPFSKRNLRARFLNSEMKEWILMRGSRPISETAERLRFGNEFFSSKSWIFVESFHLDFLPI